MKWAFGIVLVIVTGAVGAFAIYTFGWRDDVGESQAPPGWWRPEYADTKLAHMPWAARWTAREIDCLGVGESRTDGGVERYRRFDCSLSIWTGEDWSDRIVELRIGPDDKPLIRLLRPS